MKYEGADLENNRFALLFGRSRKMKKAVFFDIDGTLWDEKMQVPKSTAEAIRRLRENGNYAFICSGRSRAAIKAKELLEDIGFDGILGGCGTYVEYMGEAVYERKLSKEELNELFACFRKSGSPVVLEGRDYLYADMSDFGNNIYIQNLSKALGKGFQPLKEHIDNYHANKMTVYFSGKGREEMERELSLNYELIFHTPHVIEVIPKGFSKASGIQWICDYLHIDHENTYAFGDSVNDLEMLAYVRYGIAMGNGTPEAKNAADYVTKAIWDDGIMEGLKHFSLI